MTSAALTTQQLDAIAATAELSYTGDQSSVGQFVPSKSKIVSAEVQKVMVQVLADNCASRTDNKLLAELVNDGLRVEGIGVTTAAVVRAGRQLAGVKNFVDHLQSEVTLPAGNFVPSKSKIVSADVQKALVEVMANNTAARADNQLLTVLVNASLRLQDVGPTTAAVVWAGRRLAGVKRWCGMASSGRKVTVSVVDNSDQWMLGSDRCFD